MPPKYKFLQHSSICIWLFFFGLILLCGCSLLNDSKKTLEEKAAAELKKKNYTNLLNDLVANQCPKGTTGSKIREKFGEPDSVFQSGSSDSSFEIWTYERVSEELEEDPVDMQPIRLYFNNGQLSSWKY